MSELTVSELVELKKAFELSLATSVATRLANFREKAGGRAVISNIDIRFMDLLQGFPRVITDQAVSGVECSVRVIDKAGNYHEL